MNRGMQEFLDKHDAKPVPSEVIQPFLDAMQAAIPEIERRERERAELAHLARLGLTMEERDAVLDIRRRRRNR